MWKKTAAIRSSAEQIARASVTSVQVGPADYSRALTRVIYEHVGARQIRTAGGCAEIYIGVAVRTPGNIILETKS